MLGIYNRDCNLSSKWSWDERHIRWVEPPKKRHQIAVTSHAKERKEFELLFCSDHSNNYLLMYSLPYSVLVLLPLFAFASRLLCEKLTSSVMKKNFYRLLLDEKENIGKNKTCCLFTSNILFWNFHTAFVKISSKLMEINIIRQI